MAICLDIQPYCDECFDFEPDVVKPERVFTRNDVHYGEINSLVSNTIVRCKYRNRCGAIKRYLERGQKSEGDKV